MEKKYLVSSLHIVYVDSYEQGEQDQVNSYTLDAIISAANVREAISQYFKKVLLYDFDFKCCYIDEDNKKFLHYSVLVSSENEEATKTMIDNWQENKTILYSNNIAIDVQELTQIEIK